MKREHKRYKWFVRPSALRTFVRLVTLCIILAASILFSHCVFAITPIIIFCWRHTFILFIHTFIYLIKYFIKCGASRARRCLCRYGCHFFSFTFTKIQMHINLLVSFHCVCPIIVIIIIGITSKANVFTREREGERSLLAFNFIPHTRKCTHSQYIIGWMVLIDCCMTEHTRTRTRTQSSFSVSAFCWSHTLYMVEIL